MASTLWLSVYSTPQKIFKKSINPHKILHSLYFHHKFCSPNQFHKLLVWEAIYLLRVVEVLDSGAVVELPVHHDSILKARNHGNHTGSKRWKDGPLGLVVAFEKVRIKIHIHEILCNFHDIRRGSNVNKQVLNIGVIWQSNLVNLRSNVHRSLLRVVKLEK